MRILRNLILLAVLLLGAGEPCAQAGTVRIETAQFGGRRYLRVGDWARVNNLEIRWVRRDEVLVLTNRSSRLLFNKDSRNAELNGVNVMLSYPVVFRPGGAAYVAETDVETAILPLLHPPKNWSGAQVKKIVIDPGHGGRDPGNQDGWRQEKNYTLLLAQELSDQLKKAGFVASLTRTTDAYIEPANRAEIANRRGADLFICLHWNSVENGRNEVKGVETYCLTPAGASSSNAAGEIRDAGTKPGNRNNSKNFLLAWQMQKLLAVRMGTEDRGVRRARFAVLRGVQMPAVLIEGGYMSHPSESKRIYDAEYRRKLAGAIVEGVVAYKQQVEPRSSR